MKKTEHALCLRNISCSLRDRMYEAGAETVVYMAMKTQKCAGCSWRWRVSCNPGRLPAGGGNGLNVKGRADVRKCGLKEGRMFLKMRTL